MLRSSQAHRRLPKGAEDKPQSSEDANAAKQRGPPAGSLREPRTPQAPYGSRGPPQTTPSEPHCHGSSEVPRTLNWVRMRGTQRSRTRARQTDSPPNEKTPPRGRLFGWRRGRDSNPRWTFDPRPLSKRVPSASRSPLQVAAGTYLAEVFRQG